MKKYIYLLTIFTLLLGLSLTSCGKKEEPTNKLAVKQETPTEMKDSVVIEMDGVDGLNVLEVLKQEHEVNEVSSAMGTFVKGIDGVENDMHTFWFFEINGEMADLAADQIQTTPYDRIIWYFRQPGAEKPAEANDEK